MCALSSPAVRPIAGGGPRRAAAAPSDASERASGKKRSRVAPAQDSSACLTKMARNRNSVVNAAGTKVLTVGGEMSSQELLQKRLASELDASRGLLKKAELTSQRGACKGGAKTAGKKERFLASNQRAKPIQEDFNAPSVKRRKISTPVEQKQMPAPPPMSREERNQKQFGDDDAHGESKDDKVAEESKGKVEEVYADISGGLSPRIIETGSKPSSSCSGDPDTKVLQQKKVQDAQRAAINRAVDMRGLLYKANLCRQQLEMERAASRMAILKVVDA